MSKNVYFNSLADLFTVKFDCARFKDIFQEVYEEKWKQQFEEHSIWLVFYEINEHFL